MKIEQDKIIIDLKPYSKETIQEFAKDWLSNLRVIHEKTHEYFEHEWTNAEQLTKNHKYTKTIEVYQRTIRDYMNKHNQIVVDAISELSIQLGS
jgi:hypothetical protein